ncbi:hypothetical protein M3J09_009464 [Ascochyta lentis]
MFGRGFRISVVVEAEAQPGIVGLNTNLNKQRMAGTNAPDLHCGASTRVFSTSRGVMTLFRYP